MLVIPTGPHTDIDLEGSFYEHYGRKELVAIGSQRDYPLTRPDGSDKPIPVHRVAEFDNRLPLGGLTEAGNDRRAGGDLDADKAASWYIFPVDDLPGQLGNLESR
jgi:hypothetical protein